MMRSMKVLALMLGAMLASGQAMARGNDLLGSLTRVVESRIDSAPASSEVEVGFSPEGGAERLVVKTINAAQQSIHISAYGFTSPTITQALLDQLHRGRKVSMVVDYKANVAEDKSGKARAALSALANAGAQVRTIDTYAIHHDKVMIIDGDTVETGSFNYTDAAAKRNSENVLVLWHNPKLANSYLSHWQSRFDQGRPYQVRY